MQALGPRLDAPRANARGPRLHRILLILAAACGTVACTGAVNGPSPHAGPSPTVDCRHRTEPADAVTHCVLGDTLDVTLTSADAERFVPSSGAAAQPIRLYLDSRMIQGIRGYWDVATFDGRRMLHFDLARTDENRAQWGELLGGRGFDGPELPVAVGFEDRSVLVPAGTVRVPVSPRGWVIFVVGGLLVILLVLGIVRYRGVIRDELVPTEPGDRTYSLGRVQMAWWTVHVLAAHAVIWAFTGGFDTLTTTVLSLIGISSGTTLGAALIDASKRSLTPSEVADLQAQVASLDRTSQEMASKLAGPVGPQTALLKVQEKQVNSRLAELQRRLAHAPTVFVPASRSFVGDLLHGPDGQPVFHRLQMILWTILLTCYFWMCVWRGLEMPDFDATWLALMGISSGVYLGFKVPERTG